MLYFLITSMTMVNVMYQTSLVQFLERFDVSLERSDKTPITQRRIQFIIDYMTYEIFKYKSRGLYEVDKFMFVLMMCLKIDINRGHITQEEFHNFIKGGAALDLNACPVKPARWITDMTWLNLVELSKLRHFQYILQQVSYSLSVIVLSRFSGISGMVTLFFGVAGTVTPLFSLRSRLTKGVGRAGTTKKPPKRRPYRTVTAHWTLSASFS